MRQLLNTMIIAALVVLVAGSAAVSGQTVPAGESPGGECSGAAFRDVTGEDWFCPAVQYAAENGLMQGVGNDRFDPKGTMSRGMFAMVLARMSGADLSEYRGEGRLSDVAEGTWYHDAACWAAEEGIIRGEQGLFRPGDPITRELAAMAMHQLFRLRSDFLDFGWYDVDYGRIDQVSDRSAISEEALEGVRWAMAVGLMQGDGTRFDSQGTLTRAQAAQILSNYHKKEKRIRQEEPTGIVDIRD